MLGEALKSMRQLQAASSPGMTQAVYSSRVIFAKTDVERFVASAIPLFWECAGEKLAAVERDLAREPAAPAPGR